jgi:hypothetical protein
LRVEVAGAFLGRQIGHLPKQSLERVVVHW